MSNVQFEDSQTYGGRPAVNRIRQTSSFIKILMGLGLRQRTAEYILWGTIIVCFGITYYVVTHFLFPDTFSEKPDPKDLPIEVRMERKKFEYGQK